jgi:hypothetical protein
MNNIATTLKREFIKGIFGNESDADRLLETQRQID